jgi:hypothetical protein
MSLRALGWRQDNRLALKARRKRGQQTDTPGTRRNHGLTLSASQARQRSTGGDPYLRTSAFICGWFCSRPFAFRFMSIRGPFVTVPFSRTPGEAVGGPILGADTVVYEEKAGGIVLFFDGF